MQREASQQISDTNACLFMARFGLLSTNFGVHYQQTSPSASSERYIQGVQDGRLCMLAQLERVICSEDQWSVLLSYPNKPKNPFCAPFNPHNPHRNLMGDEVSVMLRSVWCRAEACFNYQMVGSLSTHLPNAWAFNFVLPNVQSQVYFIYLSFLKNVSQEQFPSMTFIIDNTRI